MDEKINRNAENKRLKRPMRQIPFTKTGKADKKGSLPTDDLSFVPAEKSGGFPSGEATAEASAGPSLFADDPALTEPLDPAAPEALAPTVQDPSAPPRRVPARRSIKELSSLSHAKSGDEGTASEGEDASRETPKGSDPLPSEEENAEKARRAKKKKKLRIALNVAIGVFSAVFVVCAVKFGIDLYENIKGERILHEQRDKYRPIAAVGTMSKPLTRPTPTDSGDSGAASGGGFPVSPSDGQNLTIVELQKNYPDVCGWITLDGTGVDNLYVQGKDYDRYLRRDLSGEYVVQGTLFLEPQCTRDFSSFNTIMYGHNMKIGTMFGDIDLYENSPFWEEHTSGSIYLADKTYGLQIFALLVVKSDDAVIYDPHVDTLAERENFLAYIKQNARKYRDIGATADDTFLTMSTCAYEFDGARYILMARLMTYE